MNIRPIRCAVFPEGGDLEKYIRTYIRRVKEGSVLVVTSKVVALSESRTVRVEEEARAIREESEWQKKTKYGSLTFKDGLYMWNAGLDASNAAGKLVLLPKDSFKSAARLRTALQRAYRVKKLGILITDSRIMPLRAGVVGVALGYAGFKGLRDYRGKKDIFGRKLKYTRTDIADNLASAAILTMGEGSERQPLALIEDAPVEFVERVNRKELIVPPEDDMYRPLFSRD